MQVSRGLIPAAQRRCPYHGLTMKLTTIGAPQFIAAGMRVKRKIYRCKCPGCPVVAAGPEEVFHSIHESEMSGNRW
jgi:hypothetical protein